MKTVGIIGAGIGGLTAGLKLLSKGYDVTIYEQMSRPGGKMNQLGNEDFKVDLGPTIVMMPHIYKKVFSEAGLIPEDYLKFKRIDPMYRLKFPDGFQIDATSDLVNLMESLEDISESDAEGFLKYLGEIYGRYRIAKDYFINRSFRSPKDFYNPKMLRKGLQLKTFDSAYKLISQYVKNDYLQKMLAFQTLYIGISPHNGPSIYTIIPMIETIYGVWYLEGGMYTMVEKTLEAFQQLGGHLVLNTEVEEIIVENKEATGLRINGKAVNFDYILCNADFPYAMKNLIKNESNRGKYKNEKIDQMKYSCSCFLLYLGINKKIDTLKLHNVYFAQDFNKNIESIFEGAFPEDFSMYLYSPSQLDSTVAPEGHELLYCLVPVPELSKGMTWNEETLQTVRQKVLKRISEALDMKDLESSIVFEEFMDPPKFQKQLKAYNGACFGLQPTLLQSNYYRPKNKFPYLERLYFSGSSVHPGAGVPIAITSGFLAADELLKDDGNL